MARIAGKLGKLAAVKPHGLSELAFYAQGRLPDPPPFVAIPVVPDWGMMDNDRLGCCVVAGVGHLIKAANAESDQHDPVPDDAHIQEQYFAITGGEDAGCNELSVLQLWYGSGLFDDHNKIAAFAPVRESNPLDVHASVAYFGACFIGVSLPGSAQEQFAAGDPWAITDHDEIEGGHCVVIVGYDPQYLYAVTWGAITAITYPWFAKYCDEAYAVIPQAFVEAGKGPLFDLKSLQADIGQLR